MNVEEFRANVKPGSKIKVGSEEFTVLEIVKFRMDDGGEYQKYPLSGHNILADDLAQNIYYLMKDVETTFEEPFPDKLEMNGKTFKFLYEAHAVALETEGEQIFKKGYSEKFWDFMADENNYLSLGIDESDQKRLDCLGRIVQSEEVTIAI